MFFCLFFVNYSRCRQGECPSHRGFAYQRALRGCSAVSGLRLSPVFSKAKLSALIDNKK